MMQQGWSVTQSFHLVGLSLCGMTSTITKEAIVDRFLNRHCYILYPS